MLAGGPGSYTWRYNSITAELLWPAIAVNKTADTEFSKAGDNITYTIEVENTGDQDLTLVSIDDSLLGNLTASFTATLAVNATESHNFTYTVKGTDAHLLVNNVTAIYQDFTGWAVNETATKSVDLVHPGISCNKTANPTSGIVGDNITYTIEVKNTGDVALNLTSAIDSLEGNITADFSTTLAINATKSHNYTRAINASDPDPLVNNVTFHYTVPVLGNNVYCSSNASVDIERGELIIFKYHDEDDSGNYTNGEEGLSGWNFTVTGPLGYSWAGNTPRSAISTSRISSPVCIT